LPADYPQSTARCEYKCAPGYGDVIDNPFCLGRFDYMIYSLGGIS